MEEEPVVVVVVTESVQSGAQLAVSPTHTSIVTLTAGSADIMDVEKRPTLSLGFPEPPLCFSGQEESVFVAPA
ncbi:Hypothetical predicted protein [Xyrichtys novacula]|uniref:Uncharacterized protein n=1 Tax=Xyrichtys novacula TaxID=13765 RepID=A0AAV1FUI6_XYRNO|nr:Hypothetical predicted protein [Xyrichtys novacula]